MGAYFLYSSKNNLYMKFLLVAFSFCILSLSMKAHFVLAIDILDGKVNGNRPNVPFPELKEKFSCASAVEPEGTAAKCGAGIFFKDRGLFIYTDRDYVEIDEKFKGKLSLPLIGSVRNSLFTTLGNPKMKDANWDAYQMSYGILVLHFNKNNKVDKVQFSTMGAETLNLCD
jgi:hypothetical protein